jgi:hypothetical protein
MKAIACLVVTALTSGCAATYVARPEALAAPPGWVAAERESDGALRLVRADSVAEIGRTGDGRVRLSGVRRHPARWNAGIALIVVGAVANAIAIGVAGSVLATRCNLIDGPCPSNTSALLTTAVVMGPIGDALALIAGPALMASGARARVVEAEPAP